MKALSKEGARALRALRDCRVIRVTFDDEGFYELLVRGLATVRPVDGNEDALDFILAEQAA